MFQSLFSNLKSLTIKLFLGVIALSFAVWGVGDIFRSGSDPTVAQIGKMDIKASQLARSYNRELDQLRRLTNGQIDAEQARALGIVENTLQQLINKGAIDLQSKEFRMAIPDNVVAEEIRRSPNFHNELGQFDRNIFEYSMIQNGMTEEDFVEAVRADIVRNQLVDSLLVGISPPKILARALARHETEKRSASFVIVGAESVAAVPQPSAAQIQEFYTANSQKFTSDSYRSASYVDLRPTDFISEIEIDEDTIRTEYEFQVDRFTVEDQINIDLIVFDSKDTAYAAIDRINAGEDFVSVGTSMTGLNESDLSLGLVSRSSLLPEITDVAFGTLSGSITEPIETNFGWHVVRVNEVQPGRVQNFSEAKAIIREELATEEAVELIYELSNRLEDYLAAGNSLEESARLLGINVKVVPPINANGFKENAGVYEFLPPSNAFLAAIFEAEIGMDIPIVEAEANSIFKIRLDEILEPRLLPLSSVEESVISSWQSKWQDEQARETASEFIKLAATAGFNEAALQLGLQPVVGTPFTRNGDGLEFNVNQKTIKAVFDLPMNGITEVIKLGGGRYAVGTLRKIFVDDLEIDAELKRVTQESKASLQTDFLATFQMALREKYKLTVNEQVLGNLF